MKVLLCLCALVAAAFAGAPSNKYLPPHHGAASAPEPSYQVAASAPSYQVAASAPSYQVAASAPSNQYLAPHASAPAPSYQAAPSFQVAESAPAPTFQAAPAPSFQAAPAPVQSFQSFQAAASAPAPSFQAAPAPVQVQSYQPEPAASEPVAAHTFSATDGYRYKTHRRVVYRRHRRDLSNEYLPPHQGAASAPAPSNEYLPPHAGAASAPVASFASAPEPDFAVAESAPAHSFSSADGYRYKTQRRRVIRRRRY